MNIKRECDKRIDAYHLGYNDALNNRKSSVDKALKKAYGNGYKDGQLMNKTRKNNQIIEPTNSRTIISPVFVANILQIHQSIVTQAKKEWEKEIDDKKKGDIVGVKFNKDPRG